METLGEGAADIIEVEVEDHFAKLIAPSVVGHDRGNNIMTLALQAKAMFKKMEAQKQERLGVRKVVRAKYGFWINTAVCTVIIDCWPSIC